MIGPPICSPVVRVSSDPAEAPPRLLHLVDPQLRPRGRKQADLAAGHLRRLARHRDVGRVLIAPAVEKLSRKTLAPARISPAIVSTERWRADRGDDLRAAPRNAAGWVRAS
jgi:hypothetical protein